MIRSAIENLMDTVKQRIRVCEASIQPRVSRLRVDGASCLKLVRSLWWDETSAEWFQREIEPYFAASKRFHEYRIILDVGAATGVFSLAACARFPSVKVYAFEPSHRQRILLRRNVLRNAFADRVAIEDLLAGLPFTERVRALPLDEWHAKQGSIPVNLIKMDIEGAELEALTGANNLLEGSYPDLIVQAYHEREGHRTFERCAELLARHGYICGEVGANSGLLFAEHPYRTAVPC